MTLSTLPARPAHMSVASVPAEGIDWTSVVLGVASGAGLVLLLLGLATGMRWWTDRSRASRDRSRG